MKKSRKTKDKADPLWCECECANCEIGAHERCLSQMPYAEVEGHSGEEVPPDD